MRLDVGDAAPDGPRDAVQRRDLIEDVGEQVDGFHVDEPAPEAGEVPVADLGTDDDSVLDGEATRLDEGGGIACVEPARDVGRGHHTQQTDVVPESPPPEPTRRGRR